MDGRKLATAELKDQEIENKKKSYVVGFFNILIFSLRLFRIVVHEIFNKRGGDKYLVVLNLHILS